MKVKMENIRVYRRQFRVNIKTRTAPDVVYYIPKYTRISNIERIEILDLIISTRLSAIFIQNMRTE